jgi:nucleoside-diphosphate-sugar epimerase
MRVLIFGSSGFVGTNVTRNFIKNNEEVHVVLRDNSKIWKIRDIISDLVIHKGDLTSKNKIESILTSVSPDVVINCSGIVSGFNFYDQEEVIQRNFINTVNIVNACAKLNVYQFINTGSSLECGFSTTPIRGSRCFNPPVGLYGITKRAERQYIEMVAKSQDVKYITLRLFTAFGFFDSPMRLIPHVILSLIRGEVPVIKNPLSSRDFICMDDASKVYYLLSKKPELIEQSSVFNLGTGKIINVIDIVRYLYKIANLDYREPLMDIKEISEYSYANRQEVINHLSKFGLTFTPIKESLKRTYDWFNENKNYYT